MKASGGGADSKGNTESEGVITELNEGLQPSNFEIMSWAEVELSLTDWATQASLQIPVFKARLHT